MIDLHTHTNYSDGTWNVEKLLNEAENSKIEILSITDHNTVKAHLEIRENDYSDIFSGKIIKGVELDTSFNSVKIEFLAYNFNLDKVNAWCNNTYSDEYSDNYLNNEFSEMMKSAKKNGVKLDEFIYKKEMGWPIECIFEKMKKYPENKKLFTEEEWNDINYFFRSSISNVNFPVYYNMSEYLPKASDIVKIIHDAGGKVFLAHLYKYPINDYKEYLDSLVSQKLIDGIEVYHSSFTEEQSKYLYDYCVNNNLLICGGSDCHGDKKANRKIGVGFDNLNIDKEIVAKWVDD